MKVTFSANKKTDATIENHVKVPYAASKRVFPRLRWILILLVVGSPFLYLLGKLCADWLFVTSPGTVWLEKRTINSIEPGTVEKVFFQRGEAVQPASILFQVKWRIPDNRLEQIALLEAERDAALQAGGGAVAGGLGDNGLAAQNVAYYEQALNNTRWLKSQGAATQAELDLAENKLREAKAALTAASPGPSGMNPTARIAQLEQSIIALKKMTETGFVIKAGQGGKVSHVYVSEGQSFAAGEPLAVLVDMTQSHIVTYVDPNDFKRIALGTAATVKIPGSGRKIKAVVEQSPVAADNVPGGISDKLYPTAMRGIQVFLRVSDPLQEQEAIDGLPVVVEW